MKCVLFSIMCAVFLLNVNAETHWWRFEDKSSLFKNESETELIKDSASFKESKDTFTSYIYDPLTKKSYKNKQALRNNKSKKGLAFKLPESAKSFTIEALVKPSAIPKKHEEIIRIGEVGLGINYLSQWKQAYYAGFNGKEKYSLGHYVTEARIKKENMGWQHLAIVYDSEKKEVSFYLNYWLTKTTKADLNAAGQSVQICNSWNGSIDELRISEKALPVIDFLKVRNSPVKEGTELKSEVTVLPKDIEYIDVKNFGAIGDGVHDDTWAFVTALKLIGNKKPAMYNTLYVPPGTYMVNDMLHMHRFTIIQGAGKDKTIIKLFDKSKKFSNPKKPLPILRACSQNVDPGQNKRVNGSSIGLYIFDISFNTGNNNPGAKGVEYHSNNHGAMENVNIISEDGRGPVGLDLTGKTAGPSLIQHVYVKGFDYGVTSKYQEYSNTLEHVVLEKQNKAAIFNEANILALRKINSRNSVPAIVSKGANSMIVVLDSSFQQGSSSNTAMVIDGGLYARNIEVEGYKNSIRKKKVRFLGWKVKVKEEVLGEKEIQGNITEFVGDNIISPFGDQKGSLNLPIEETPSPAWGDIKTDWVNIKSAQAKEITIKDSKGKSKTVLDWSDALQSLIDSGAKTIYFPQGTYWLSKPVHLRKNLVRIFGMRSEIKAVDDLTGPSLIYDREEADKELTIERIDIAHIEHQSPGTLILHHSSPDKFTNKAGCGKLFLEDVMAHAWHFNHPQKIWCRQWNPEQHWNKFIKKDKNFKTEPDIISKGATIWSLGFKTEYDSSKLHASNGAKTEILGGFVYPVVKGIPKDRPVFTNTDSSMSLIYGLSFYSAGWTLQVKDTQQGKTIDTIITDLTQSFSRFRCDLYRSGE